MNNDIVVKQKPDTQAAVGDLAVKQPPQTTEPVTEQPDMPQAESTPDDQPHKPQQANQAVEATKPSQPVGVIVIALFIATCLIVAAIYIGYNQS